MTAMRPRDSIHAQCLARRPSTGAICWRSRGHAADHYDHDREQTWTHAEQDGKKAS